LRFQNTKQFAGYYNLSVAVSGEKVSTVMTLFRTAGQYPVVLQARTKCFVLQRIRVFYISLQFNSVVCNYGLFHARAVSVFGKKSDAVLRFSDPPFPILISASILGKRARQCYAYNFLNTLVKVYRNCLPNQKGKCS